MPVRSAGLLIYRFFGPELQVLLVHPGGPFWTKKDEGAWSIPKGLVEPDEDELAAAIRETQEELGVVVEGPFVRLGEFKQPGGKIVVAWSTCADSEIDPGTIRSQEFQLEWPPKSGVMKSFPEVDRAGWFSIADAERKLLKGQRALLGGLSQVPGGLSGATPG